ncbi:MAG: Fic family protein [Candidatus Melainabacteria bacterium]|nr:Fic family protein [Candidatus Melainabacteria bacterium]
MKFFDFRPTHEMLRLIAEIDEFKGSWKSFSTIAADRLASLKHVATIQSIGSSTRIEGATLSDDQVEELLSNISKKSFRSRDEQEVAGYADVMETIFLNWHLIPLSENHIKQLHRDLMKHSTKDDRHRGNYKSVQNNVEAFGPDGERLGTIFKTATPFDTPFKMTELIEWTNVNLQSKEIHPLLLIAVFIAEFLAIHPFQDGNGRLSRALTTLLLLKQGYAYVPYSSMENVIEAGKESYYLALRKTQTTLALDKPDWDPWIQFFLESMQKQKANLQSKISREHLIEGKLPLLSVRILKLIREQGRLKMSDIEALTGESRSTIKLRLNELIGRKMLSRNGKGPSTWYTIS